MAALLCLLGGEGQIPAATARTVECPDYCGERAAEHCDRIDSWGCTWYILGCLAGCNIAQL
jgi:hypothetical protein